MSEEPVISITKPEKQLIEKDNLEIEINNYDNSHLYYKGFDLGTFKEIVNLRQENKILKENNMSMQEEMVRTWEKADLYKEVIDKTINAIDLVIELIKQQPTEDDRWILDRLNGFKIILEDKEVS